MPSTIIKRSIVIGTHKTSLSMEDQFWNALKAIAERKKTTIAKLVEAVAAARTSSNLSSSVRIFILEDALKGRSND